MLYVFHGYGFQIDFAWKKNELNHEIALFNTLYILLNSLCDELHNNEEFDVCETKSFFFELDWNYTLSSVILELITFDTVSSMFLLNSLWRTYTQLKNIINKT